MSSASDPGLGRVTTPWWRSPTAYTVLLGIVAAIPGYAPQVAPFVPPSWQGTLKLVAVLCGLVSSVLAHQGGTNNAARLDLAGVAEAEKVLAKGAG